MKPGRFITIEGIEGAGKSTLAVVRASDRSARLQCITYSRAGRHGAGRADPRQLCSSVATRRSRRRPRLLLMFAARSSHIDNVMRPALAPASGWSAIASPTRRTRIRAEGAASTPPGSSRLRVAVHAGLEPDLTLLLDLPVETGLARARRRRGEAQQEVDRFESETLAFFSRVRARYLQIAAAAPQRVRVIDAAAAPADVQAAALAALAALETL
jgi:dTMP kinase